MTGINKYFISIFKYARIFIFASFFFSGFSASVFAQDTQYWTNQYGTYGELLGGTIIGSASDLSATFYNPGALAFSTDSALVLTTGSYQLIFLDFNNITGSSLDLSYWYTNTSKGIFAMRLPFHFIEGDQIAVSGLARTDFNFYAEDIYLSDYPTENFESSRISINHKISEFWYGASWSKSFSKKIGIGVSVYVPYRSQTEKRESIFQTYDPDNLTGDVLAIAGVDYYNVRALLKGGISYRDKNYMLGLSLTTPSVNILGKGSSSLLLSKSNTGLDTLADIPDMLSDYQENLKTYYYSPLSIGFGGAYYFERTSLYFSAEWFNKVNEYGIMKPEKFVVQSTGKSVEHNVKYSLKSVFNFGFGIKYKLNENFIFYGSITTDRSAFDSDNPNQLAISTWDIIHIRSGSEFKYQNLKITLGFGYGYSGELFNNFDFFGIFENKNTDVIYHQIDIIFGFSYLM
ncbi:MAG: hypothetical protein GXO87_13855 [Chlorobi bacterium]|nr:hypothetical protein [Chlorobiota bacterium]